MNELIELRVQCSRLRSAVVWHVRLLKDLLTAVDNYARLKGDCSAEGNEKYEDLINRVGRDAVQLDLFEEYETWAS